MFWRSHKPLIMTRAKPQSFFSGIFGCPSYTYKYKFLSKALCSIYFYLTDLQRTCWTYRKKKYIVPGSLWKRLLRDCVVCLILLSFQRIQDNFSTAAIAKLFTDYILNAKNTVFETISLFFPFFSFQFSFFCFLPFFFFLLYNLCKYFPEIYALIYKKPWPVGMRHERRKCIVYLIINLRGFREN